MPYRYIFTGIIHPERAAVDISTIIFKIQMPNVGIDGKLDVTISCSQVTAVFESEQEVPELYSLKNYAMGAVYNIVDAYGYLTGRGYGVEIVQVLPAESTVPLVFGVNIPVLEEQSTDLDIQLTEVLKLFMEPNGSYIRRCFSDLREAIRSPKDTGFFCYRAIESLRHYLVNELNMQNDKESWEKFRTILGIDRITIDYIKSFADPVRHGGEVFISDSDRGKILKCTWSIVREFIEFAKRGYIPIDK